MFEWWEHFKTDSIVKTHVKTNFPYKKPLSTDTLLEKFPNGSHFGYIQCNLIVSDELKSAFFDFP